MHSYIGYNTVGASHGGVTQYAVLCKKVVLAAAGLVASIGAYFEETGDHVNSLSVALFTDNANKPNILLGHSVNPPTSVFPGQQGSLTVHPGWRHVPLGLWVPAGTYWLGIQDTGPNPMELFYDTGGSDQTWTAGGAWFTDAPASPSDSTFKYSIRADLIS